MVAHLSILLVPRTSVTAKERNSSPANAFPTLTVVVAAVPSPLASAQGPAPPSRMESRVAASVEALLLRPRLLQHRPHQHKLHQQRLLPQQLPRVAQLSILLVPRTLVMARDCNSSEVSASALPTAGADAVLVPLEFALVLAHRRKLARPVVVLLRSDLSGNRQVLFQTC